MAYTQTEKLLIEIENHFHGIYELMYSNAAQDEVYKEIVALTKNAQELKERFYDSPNYK